MQHQSSVALRVRFPGKLHEDFIGDAHADPSDESIVESFVGPVLTGCIFPLKTVFSILCIQHNVRASSTFRRGRPLLDKDMGIAGILEDWTGNRMNWFLNGISLGVRKMGKVARACAVK